MIRLDRPDRPVDRKVLHAPGGFLWWYAEVLDDEGTGAVIIWSYGLPFLPGYKRDAVRGEAPETGARPSLNIALYKKGEPVFYVLHEFDPKEVQWGQNHWRFGDNLFAIAGPKNDRTLSLHISCPITGSAEKLVGTITVKGPEPRIESPLGAMTEQPHAWCPLILPAKGGVHLKCGGFELDATGTAYHDRNYSDTPLHQLGIGTWVWGHTSSPSGDRIFYALWPESGEAPTILGFEITPAGNLNERALKAVWGRKRRTAYGMPTWDRITLMSDEGLWLDVRPQNCVDDGPFYLRYKTRNVLPKSPAQMGSCEVIVPSRIDLARHRPLVRMRVSGTKGGGSMWLPLFEGDASTRLQRLARHWRKPLRDVITRLGKS